MKTFIPRSARNEKEYKKTRDLSMVLTRRDGRFILKYPNENQNWIIDESYPINKLIVYNFLVSDEIYDNNNI